MVMGFNLTLESTADNIKRAICGKKLHFLESLYLSVSPIVSHPDFIGTLIIGRCLWIWLFSLVLSFCHCDWTPPSDLQRECVVLFSRKT